MVGFGGTILIVPEAGSYVACLMSGLMSSSASESTISVGSGIVICESTPPPARLSDLVKCLQLNVDGVAMTDSTTYHFYKESGGSMTFIKVVY